MTFTAPTGSLGADLFWWRETGVVHTLVTVSSRSFDGLLDDVVLHCVLFDAAGSSCASWTVPMAGREFVAIDSANLGEWVGGAAGLPQVESGILAVYTVGRLLETSDGDRYHRLYSMVDWYCDGPDGWITGLHNDQSVVSGRARPIDLTEITVLESPSERNSLVIVNGEAAQPAGALSVTVANSGGASRSASYQSAMAPFTVHQVRLAELFPRLDAFGGGEHLSVSGTFSGQGMYLRPYVITEGARFSAYHGGDVYRWGGLPSVHYRLLGSGEVNPMAVLHRPGEIETTVNLFNSHGSIEDSFWVDAELFDTAGTSVAKRAKWKCARRNAVVRGDVAELLPDPEQTWTGHIALTFSEAEVEMYPQHLQALLEYRAAGGMAHVMAWSDEWNSLIKLHTRKRDGALMLRSYYRVWAGRGFSTFVSITNAGHGAYRENAPCTIRLIAPDGATREVRRELQPRETLFANIAELFPDAAALLGPGAVGMLEVESEFDLANVQFVRHDATGGWAAEHFMAATTREGDRVGIPAGS